MDVRRLRHELELLRDGRAWDGNGRLHGLVIEREKAHRELRQAQRDAETVTHRRDRPRAAERLRLVKEGVDRADTAWSAAVAPVEQRLRSDLRAASATVDELTIQHRQRRDWVERNPEAVLRLAHLERSLESDLEFGHDLNRTAAPTREIEPRGPDLGLGL